MLCIHDFLTKGKKVLPIRMFITFTVRFDAKFQNIGIFDNYQLKCFTKRNIIDAEV